MRITNAEDYALRTMLHLAGQPVGAFCAIEAVARGQEIPVAFLRKLMRPLQRAGLVVTRRGAEGGVALGRPAGEISFRQVLEALDGPIVLQACVAPDPAHVEPCGVSARCRMRETWRRIQAQFLESLDGVRVGDLVAPLALAGVPERRPTSGATRRGAPARLVRPGAVRQGLPA
jgi:Rrf2 family protein